MSITDKEKPKLSGNEIPVFDIGVIPDVKELRPGEITSFSREAALQYIKNAVLLAVEGIVQGFVTAPINKNAIRKAGYQYIGHTELLCNRTHSKNPVTMFTIDQLNILFHSRRIALREAIRQLTAQGVHNSIMLAEKCLQSIGYEKPSLVLAALNPHASDGGFFGMEEQTILIPACEHARQMGIHIDGPVTADSVFHRACDGEYDGVVSLYHNQGHIAAKTYDFYLAVSVTLGLPFIRTSVDYRTAFDIAWQGSANPLSMEEAVITAFDLCTRYRPL